MTEIERIPDTRPSPFDVIARSERSAIIDACKDTLTEEAVAVLDLRYGCNLTYREIARALHSTEDAVEALHRRSLERIATALLQVARRQIEAPPMWGYYVYTEQLGEYAVQTRPRGPGVRKLSDIL